MRSNRKGQVVLCAVVSAPQARSWIEPVLQALVDSNGPIVGCSMQVFDSTGDAVSGPEPGQLIAGDATVHEQVGPISVRLQPLSFFQVNPFALESLVMLVGKLALGGNKKTVGLLDLYCGGGVLGLAVAGSTGEQVRLTGVDIDPRAIESAREDAARAAIDARFEAGPAATVLQQLLPERGPFDVVLVDPPRRGLRVEAITELKATGADKILYVSCHGPSLARDTLLLERAGYQPTVLMPLDMLPQTAHLEWVTLFSKTAEPTD
jgi:23S rRNA (uracil1939-C5)-methyltransferase